MVQLGAWRALCAAAVVSAAGAAFGQAGDNVRLDVRVVPQAGTLPGAITDGTPGGAASPITASGQVRRFEVQYRIIVPAGGTGFTPAGLVSGNLRVVASGETGNSTLERAILSRFESQTNNGATPPSATDNSGAATGSFASPNEARGLHRPYRGGVAAPAPNNNSPANGAFLGNNLIIVGITPLALSQTDQNQPGGPDGLGAYYGLFSLNFVGGSDLGPGPHTVTITASFDPDSTTGNRYGFFDDGNPVPITSGNAVNGTATVQVVPTGPTGACCRVDGSCTQTFPAECADMYLGDNTSCFNTPCTAGAGCCVPNVGCLVRTAMACASGGGATLGVGSTCSPNPCPPPYACCFPNFVCLLANTTGDCAAAGGTARMTATCSPMVCCPAVMFVLQPTDVLFTPPQTAMLSVSASSPAPLSYRWRKSGISLFDGGRISGATTPMLSIAGTVAGDAGTYDVVVTASCGTTVTSSTANLIPCSGPSVGTQPLSVTAPAGGGASLSVAASGAGMLQYQWRKNGVAFGATARITGVGSPVLAISGLQPGDDALYDCAVSSPCGVAYSQLASIMVSCAGAGAGLDCNGNGVCDALELTGLRDITAPAPASGDRFGWSVSIDGSRVLVGARTADTVRGVDSGAAYIYVNTGGSWTLEAALLAPDGAGGDDFGNQVALQGQWAAVSAKFSLVSGVVNAGAVYIYRNTGQGWQSFQKLSEPVPTGNSEFGHGLKIDSDRLVIGAINGNGAQPGSGVAYVHRFNGLNWAREATLTAPDGSTGDGFGISVAISDPYAIVGAPYDTEGEVSSGSAYVFFRSVTGWVMQSKLNPRDPQAAETFGELVGMSGDHAAVNCPRAAVDGLAGAGAVYTFRRTDTRWTQQRRLTAPTPQAGELFGYYTAIDGTNLGAGGFRRQVGGFTDAGAVDIFKRRGNFWTRADRIDCPKPETPSFFGYALAISGGRMAAGAFQGSARLVPGAGWVRVFDLAVLDCNDNGTPDICEIAQGTALDADGNGIPDACQGNLCRADFNDSGVLSVQDIFDFLTDYFTGNLTADFNDSGVLSVQDIFDFLTAYFTGCL